MIVRHHSGEYAVDFVTREQLNEAIDGKPILTDRDVAAALGLEVEHFAIEPGEGSKNLDSYAKCIDWLVRRRTKRTDQIVAIGGGVVGDLVGFVAATYMRGIRYIQVPSTLLAMVDSSVGGKVGIDHGEGKNLIGAFHPPTRVLVCGELLTTLPDRQVRNGFAEVLKYGFIYEPAILEQDQPTANTIRRCIEIKAHIVEVDEFETKDLRAILNFGHTVGHAIEAITGYKELLHGEAISIGMAVEARLGERLGITAKGTYAAVRDRLVRAGLPVTHPSLMHADRLTERMKLDKKRAGDGLSFSFLTRIGQCKLVHNIDAAEVIRACEEP